MNYEKVKKSVNGAWDHFFDYLEDHGGFTPEQIVEMARVMDMKDALSAVLDSAMEATR